MNSQTSLINFKYMFENVKKSKYTIMLNACVVPIFTLLIIIINSKIQTKAVLLEEIMISIPAILSMFVIPFVISLQLFDFAHSKRKVDLTGSFPLKRSTIFITNSLAGIIIFLIIFGITSLILLMSRTFIIIFHITTPAV